MRMLRALLAFVVVSYPSNLPRILQGFFTDTGLDGIMTVRFMDC